jgi:hypothetical protein
MKMMQLKNMMSALAGLGLVGGILPNALAAADSAKPSPAAEAKITQAIKAAFPSAVINKMAKETEDGISFYEVSLAANGQKIDANVTSDGTIIETEESTDMKLFPKPAADAIKKAAKGMEISGGEMVKTYANGVKDDTTGDTQMIRVVKLGEPTVSYEVNVAKDGNKGELAVSADGKVLEVPKWAATVASKPKTEEKENEAGPLVSISVTVVSPEGKVLEKSKSEAKAEAKSEAKPAAKPAAKKEDTDEDKD